MNEFAGYTKEEVIRSGSSRIGCIEFLLEDHPCKSCPCVDSCATGLSCAAFTIYLEANKKKREKWRLAMRIPTRWRFNRL